MDEKKDYINELELLKEKRELENEKSKNELGIERQRTRTEKAKQGRGKLLVKCLIVVSIMVVSTILLTWFISLFFPENVEKAINIFRNIF